MSAITFDAIESVDKLIEVGISEPQAKAQVKILQDAIDKTVKNQLATKGDVFEIKAEMATKNEILKIEKRLNRLEILMSILLAVQAIPVIKSLMS